MSETLIIYYQHKRYHLLLEEGKTYELSAESSASLVFASMDKALLLTIKDGVLYEVSQEQPTVLSFGKSVADFIFYLETKDKILYDPLQRTELLVGKREGSDIWIENSSVDFLLTKMNGQWQLTLFSGEIYLNNLLIQQPVDNFLLELGDEIAFEEKLLKVYPDEIMVAGNVDTSSLVEIARSKYDFYADYPDYHRSPRIIYRSSEEKVILSAPASEPSKPKDELLKLILPPLMMVGVTVLISIFQPRGLYIIATITMSIMTTIFSVQGYFKNRKQYKIDLQERIDSYHQYLSDKSIALTELSRKQKDGQLYHYPSIETLDMLAESYSHRIYEKTPLHFDFLYYRLGLGEVPVSYNLSYSQQERSGKKDPLESEGYALYYRHLNIPNMPIVANLSHGPVGYIGPRPLVLEQLQLMVNQIAVFHSYHDVQFITIMPEEEQEQWDWMRWLPHATLQEMNVRGFVYNQRTRDQVLNSLNQILKMRKTQSEDKTAKESLLFHPHYIVLVTDEKLILDHVIMEFFTEDPTALGCSIIFVQDVMSSLSENIKTIINIKDRNTGQLVMEEGELREHDFALDHFPEGYDKERIARRLAPLNHLQSLKSSIPDSVTFMEMYGAEEFADLKVLERWAQNSPYKSLAVPLGLRGQDDIVYLNLHEKAHGPHGLVAGTTGSGKSEIIQSYILSLAVNFHPHDVAFLLIDYKGGGMANLFKDLPHLLGTITNLDGAQSMRALVSINAELKRRQRLFAQADVNHINQYQKKYKLGEVSEPMPHLFLISDEFAELKANQPDFMTELVSTARIGRSLGIHLILATQKPTGVVNDQIWSNSRFKLALKVADRSDSQEMLRTPDAADITQAGRAYLQVGNNEVYELFQSAWSGADYQPDKDDQGIEDRTIYAINALGQYEVLNEDLSGLEEAEDIRQVPTELDAIVENLKALTAKEGIKALPQPWLPPLSDRVFLSDLRPQSYSTMWQEKTARNLQAILGYVDIPSKQSQENAVHDFQEDGNLVLFSSPTMGKSTFLQTIVMDLARQFTPEKVQFYLFDFGTNGLLPLRKLPHVIDNLMTDSDEKLSKVIDIIKKEVDNRKKLFSRFGVPNIDMYEEASGELLPHLFLMIDSYDGVKETNFTDALEALFLNLSRDGVSLGIHLVITASRTGALRPAIMTNIKSKIVLKMSDDNEARTIIGRTQLIIDDIQGRGLIYIDQPEVFQVALPTRGENSIQVIQALREEIEEMDQTWTGARPKPIPVMPERIDFATFKTMPDIKQALTYGELPIGLDFKAVEGVIINMDRFKHLLLIADNDGSQTALTNHLLQTVTTLRATYKVMLVDASKEYAHFQQYADSYLVDGEILTTYAQQLSVEIGERLKQESGTLKPWFIVIPNLSAFMEQTKISLEVWNYLFENGYKAKVYFIIGSFYQKIGVSSDPILKKVRTEAQYVLLGMRLMDQSFLEKVYNSKEVHLAADEVYLHDRRDSIKLKISYEGESK